MSKLSYARAIRDNKRAIAGEMAVRGMSAKAREFYYGTDGIGIMAIEEFDEEREVTEVFYELTGWLVRPDHKYLTFAEVEAIFEELWMPPEEDEDFDEEEGSF